jgi:hypothetical protein
MVYDFSFERSPKILPLKQYMSEMYIPKNSFDINGSSFRVRGEGPTYTAAHATKELKDYQFKIMTADRHGNFTEVASRLNFEQFYQSVK